MPELPSPCMMGPRLPPDPKPDGIEGISCAERAPAVPRDQATAKNSIFFIDTSFFCGVRSGGRGGGHPEGGNRLIIGTSKVRSQNGPCQGAGRALGVNPSRSICRIPPGGWDTVAKPFDHRFEVASERAESSTLLLFLPRGWKKIRLVRNGVKVRP